MTHFVLELMRRTSVPYFDPQETRIFRFFFLDFLFSICSSNSCNSFHFIESKKHHSSSSEASSSQLAFKPIPRKSPRLIDKALSKQDEKQKANCKRLTDQSAFHPGILLTYSFVDIRQSASTKASQVQAVVYTSQVNYILVHKVRTSVAQRKPSYKVQHASSNFSWTCTAFRRLQDFNTYYLNHGQDLVDKGSSVLQIRVQFDTVPFFFDLLFDFCLLDIY
ncbi:hypothetical protein C5167_029558 [Papaver somniferum]|nr:hypothetical protein C5167_029558 [Papaver somniferum]